MTKLIVLDKSFSFYKKDSMWFTYLNEISNEATFEVYAEEINISLVEKILKFLTTEKYNLLESKCRDLLLSLSNQFWEGAFQNPYFDFSGIIIRDFKIETDFQLLFQMSSDEDDFGSDYANWIVNIKDFRIIGAFREQL